MIVLDTHALLWLDTDSEQLGPHARAAIVAAFQQRALGVSAITFWECAMLAQRGRITLPYPVSTWRRSLLTQGLREWPVDGDFAIAAAGLPMEHRDPADRLIAATALTLGAALLTADVRLQSGVVGLRVVPARG